jgi:hypothetical protein
MENKILEIIAFTIPSIVTAGVSYYLFKSHFKDQQNTRRWLLQKENQKEALPLRLQAYERLSLYLERINPPKLLIRVAPLSKDKNDYENYIISQIEQEFDHNLSQQIYVSEDCWTIVKTAKNATIQMIRKTNMSEKIDSADKLRETILNDSLDKVSTTGIALSFINTEVKELLF